MRIHRGGGASVGVVKCEGLGKKEMVRKENRDGVLMGGNLTMLPLYLCDLNCWQ